MKAKKINKRKAQLMVVRHCDYRGVQVTQKKAARKLLNDNTAEWQE